MSDILKEAITVEVCEVELGDTIDEVIAALQAAREKVPPEFRSVATVTFAAHDWEGVYVEYVRQPTAEERAKAEAIFADRARLIGLTTPKDMTEWIRNVRIGYSYGPGMMASTLDIAEAEEMIRSNEDAVRLHPKFNWKTKLVTDEP